MTKSKHPTSKEEDKRIRQAIENATAASETKWGYGWVYLGADMRSDAIRANVLAQIAGMDEDTVSEDICRRIIRIASAACRSMSEL